MFDEAFVRKIFEEKKQFVRSLETKLQEYLKEWEPMNSWERLSPLGTMVRTVKEWMRCGFTEKEARWLQHCSNMLKQNLAEKFGNNEIYGKTLNDLTGGD